MNTKKPAEETVSAEHSSCLPTIPSAFTVASGGRVDALSKRLPDPQPLHDFLYRDAGRMASYYAQIFSSRLSSLEQADSERTSKDTGISAGSPSPDRYAFPA